MSVCKNLTIRICKIWYLQIYLKITLLLSALKLIPFRDVHLRFQSPSVNLWVKVSRCYKRGDNTYCLTNPIALIYGGCALYAKITVCLPIQHYTMKKQTALCKQAAFQETVNTLYQASLHKHNIKECYCKELLGKLHTNHSLSRFNSYLMFNIFKVKCEVIFRTLQW